MAVSLANNGENSRKLQNAAHQSAIDAECGAIDTRGNRTADVSNKVGDLLWIKQAFNQRSWTVFAHETPIGFLGGELRKKILHQLRHSLGAG